MHFSRKLRWLLVCATAALPMYAGTCGSYDSSAFQSYVNGYWFGAGLNGDTVPVVLYTPDEGEDDYIRIPGGPVTVPAEQSFPQSALAWPY